MKVSRDNVALFRFLLVLGGFACGGLLILILRANVPALDPAPRFIFRERDGDTFRHQPGLVRPPEGNAILEDGPRAYGADGFRVPQMRADFYPIVALGDSFTEGGERPWVDVLAAELDTPVQNMGWRGWGPLQEAAAFLAEGSPSHEWVLLAYFEGNDLSNIQTAYQQWAQTGNLDLSREQVRAEDVPPFEILTNSDNNYLYPLQHPLNGQNFELAYISDYLWWLNGAQDLYAQSRNLAELGVALESIQGAAGDACVALVYLPTKEHIYFPYSDPQGNRIYVMQNGLALQLDAEGWLSFGPLAPQEDASVMANLDNQRDAVAALARELHIAFIDLTPVLQAAVFTGPPTYYVYDSHFSQRGHDLVGQAIANYIMANPNCSHE